MIIGSYIIGLYNKITKVKGLNYKRNISQYPSYYRQVY